MRYPPGVSRRLACAVVATTALLVPLSAAAAAVTRSAGKITAAGLGQMVLPRTLLGGGRFDLLAASPSSGPLALADAPRYTLDPKDTQADLAAEGWVAGYDQSWGPGFAPDGTFFGGTTVQLFRTDQTAALFHVRQADSFRTYRSRPIDGGWILASTTQWVPAGIGPDAFGVRNVFRSKAGVFYDTEVHLRVGRVLGEVGLISNRNTDLQATAEADAKRLALRIERVIAAAR